MLISRRTPKKVVLELGKSDCRSRNCSFCCTYGSGFLDGSDVLRIAKFLRLSEEELKKRYLEEVERFHTRRLRPRLKSRDMPYGPCVFHESGAGCAIYPVRPLQCRVGSCNSNSADLQKWFDLNYFVDADDPQSVRDYALWLEFNEPLPGGRIEELVPNELKRRQMLNYEVI